MAVRTGLNLLNALSLAFVVCGGCGHHGKTSPVSRVPTTVHNQPVMLAVAPVNHATFKSSSSDIQFDYPNCWVPCKNHMADFTLEGPALPSETRPTICLDVPKMPWHIPGMIPIAMVARGYVDDLRSNLMADAQIQEQSSLTVCGSTARRVTCVGHVRGKPCVDIAVIMIHADQIYILSADSDDAATVSTRQTLDDSLKSLKWLK